MHVNFTVEAKLAPLTDQACNRYALGHVQITPATGGVWLTATTGTALAVRYAPGGASSETLCPAAALPAPSGRTPATLKWAGGRWENSNGMVTPQTVEPGIFPRTDDVLPMVTTAAYLALTLDAVLLHKLADAISAPLVKTRLITLLIPKPTQGTGSPTELSVVNGRLGVVSPLGQIGLIVPCTVQLDQIAAYEATRAAFVRDKRAARIATEVLETTNTATAKAEAIRHAAVVTAASDE